MRDLLRRASAGVKLTPADVRLLRAMAARPGCRIESEKKPSLKGRRRPLRPVRKPTRYYRGLWKPLPKPIKTMTREEVQQHLRGFRRSWERQTGRTQDLYEDYLEQEPITRPAGRRGGLRNRLAWYFSDGARRAAERWIERPKRMRTT